MIISPYFQVSENEVLFAVRNLAYVANTETNEITEAEEAPAEFINLMEALSAFTFENNTIKWYHGVSRMSYDMVEGKFYLSSGEVLKESFVNHILAAGVIRYEDKKRAELFVEAASNVDKYISLDFVKTFEGTNNIVDLFVLEGNIYTTVFNKSTRLQKFSKAESANEALELVKTKTEQDATTFLAGLLEGEAAERAEALAKATKLEEMISFLKDQRNMLAEADRSIEEIKQADMLIEGEINRLQSEINELI